MKPKILFILNLPPPINGANLVGKYIQSSKFINEHFETKYINSSTSTELKSLGKFSFQKILLYLKIFYNVVKHVVGSKYDLHYLTLTAKGIGFYKDCVTVLILKSLGKNIIFHFHNKGISIYDNIWYNKILYKLVFYETKSIILSELLYYDIQKYVSKSNVYICPNGLPLNELTNNDCNSTSNDVVRLLFLSNMMVEKGVLELLKVCVMLKDSKINFECHFVGAWSDISKEYFYQYIDDNKISEQVKAHGKKIGTEKDVFFKSADIFIFPSYYNNEAFPLVIIEAMQASLPVISTFEGGIPDVVKDGESGILVPQLNVSLLYEKTRLLIENKDLRIKMGKAGRKRYENLFTLEIFEHNMKNILLNAISY